MYGNHIKLFDSIKWKNILSIRYQENFNRIKKSKLKVLIPINIIFHYFANE